MNTEQISPTSQADQQPPAFPRGWKRFWLIVKVIEVRLRFVALLVVTGLAIGYWDTLQNYFHRWTRAGAAAPSGLASGEEFYCPMHPQVTRSGLEPNGEVPQCPICGMRLSKHKKGDRQPLPAGVTARVQLSPERIQLAGVQTVEVGYRPLSRKLRALGNVAYDETRLSRVTSRVAGYVERLYIDQTFASVNKGDPLAEIYSPELYSTIQEIMLAKERNETSLVTSGLERLKLLGVGADELQEIMRSSQAEPRLLLRAPRAGRVVSKPVLVGSRIEAGTVLLEIADLSTVWVEANVFERDVALLRQGEPVAAVVEAFAGRTFDGQIALIYPEIDRLTRTNRVRFSLDNHSFDLRPGMFATVSFDVSLSVARTSDEDESADEKPAREGEVLAVPDRAVIDTGAKKIVYVDRGEGVFEGVEVELGPRSDGWYAVVDGLRAGDRVAAAGAFLIDAETRLNPSAAAAYAGAAGGPTDSLASSHDRHAIVPDAAEETAPPQGEPDAASLANIAKLPAADREGATQQSVCPITGEFLGSMGVPQKIRLAEKDIFLCCRGCIKSAEGDPKKTLDKLDRRSAATDLE